MPLNIISKRFENSGVLYPLQTLSKERNVNGKTIPICIEGNNNNVVQKLFMLANMFSDNVINIDSAERKVLHIGAVFVSNFVNYLYTVASDIFKKNGLQFDLLKPLIKEVADKVNVLTPEEAQTGPARRNDITVIKEHEEFLSKTNKEFLELYKIITKQIIKRYYE
jgi:predicted short-subunit dehydrogenase-like oxidoreductase (DUF2520 family)